MDPSWTHLAEMGDECEAPWRVWREADTGCGRRPGHANAMSTDDAGTWSPMLPRRLTADDWDARTDGPQKNTGGKLVGSRSDMAGRPNESGVRYQDLPAPEVHRSTGRDVAVVGRHWTIRNCVGEPT